MYEKMSLDVNEKLGPSWFCIVWQNNKVYIFN